MSFLESIPTLSKYIYKAIGVIQFSAAESLTYSRLWCIPIFAGYFYLIYYMQFYTSVVNLDVFEYLEILTIIQNVVLVLVYAIIFFKRARNTKQILGKIDNIKLYALTTSRRFAQPHTFFRRLLLVMLFTNFGFIIASNKIQLLIHAWLPRALTTAETLFINDLFYYVSAKFELINQHLKRQTSSVELATIFPLTKTNKIKILEDDDLSFKIERINELSGCHYDLVHLAIELGKNFEFSIVFSLVLWFAFVIESVYSIIFYTVNIKDMEVGGVLPYGLDGSYVLYLFISLAVLVSSFSHTQFKVPIR